MEAFKLEALGYTVTEMETPVGGTGEYNEPAESRSTGPFPYITGAATALGVIGFYLGLLTLTSDWYNASIQFSEFRWWIIALSLGLGVQAALFTFMKKRLQKNRLKSARSGLAASGGMSTASMAACCAHYLVPLLPTLGLPFLSAAVAGIADYQAEIFLLGVLSNLFGLGVMLRVMSRYGIFKIGNITGKVKFGFQRS